MTGSIPPLVERIGVGVCRVLKGSPTVVRWGTVRAGQPIRFVLDRGFNLAFQVHQRSPGDHGLFIESRVLGQDVDHPVHREPYEMADPADDAALLLGCENAVFAHTQCSSIVLMDGVNGRSLSPFIGTSVSRCIRGLVPLACAVGFRNQLWEW